MELDRVWVLQASLRDPQHDVVLAAVVGLTERRCASRDGKWRKEVLFHATYVDMC